MKVKIDDSVFIIPESNYPIIVEFNGYKNIIVDCLNSYFTQKKKTKCRIFDEFGNDIKCDGANFIYVPKDVSIDNNMELKNKSIINNVLVDFIQNNPDDFMSIDMIRKGVLNLVTDKGMYKAVRIMTRGVSSNLKIDYSDVKIPYIVESMLLEDSLVSSSDRIIYLYNLLLYLNRDKYNIVLIDSKLTENLERWILQTKTDNNIILIDNESCEYIRNNSYNLLSLSSQDFCEELIINENNISLYSYLLHPVVRINKQYQIEKNQEIITEIEDKSITFFLKTS